MHLFLDLKYALVSIGLFCDNGYLALVDKTEVTMIDKNTNKVIMKGGRDPPTKLFMLDITRNEMTEIEIKPSLILEQFSKKTVYKCSSKQNLVIYLHQACFSPPVSTWIAAIKKNAL